MIHTLQNVLVVFILLNKYGESSSVNRSLQFDFGDEYSSTDLLIPNTDIYIPNTPIGTSNDFFTPNPTLSINYPTKKPSKIPISSLSTTPTNFGDSLSPTLWPQNTCYFSIDRTKDQTCVSKIMSNGTKEERSIPMDHYMCSSDRRYRFGITSDKFLCFCDGIAKVWCADSQKIKWARNPHLCLQNNGQISAYSGRKKLWDIGDLDFSSQATHESDETDSRPLFFGQNNRDPPVTQLEISADGTLQVTNYTDQSVILWTLDINSYTPYYPPTSSPTISIKPSSYPTTSPVPTFSQAPTHKPTDMLTYNPGKLLTQFSLGMRISEGLSIRLIGRTGNRLRLADGTFSLERVHDQPDAGACYDQPNGGWIYVSNSEVPKTGGVGAFKFDPDGNVVNYKMIQTGTNMNCGGGKTPWGTWFSGEEWPNGEQGGMWEVDIRGYGARMTKFGRGKFESATCDDRDMNRLNCFATLDSQTESIRRYTPSATILSNAISTGDYSNVMHSIGGRLTYLLLNPISRTFSWTSNKSLADSIAEQLYPNTEGIDHHDGVLYFVSKIKKQIFALDLDRGTYQVSSTESGSFEAQPDQIAHIIGDDPNGSSFMYFLEDGGQEPGIHARNLQTNKAFTILEKLSDGTNNDEATGLAFCDNYKRMIFAFQERGTIYEVTREDGKPFYGATVNVKYHNTAILKNKVSNSSD